MLLTFKAMPSPTNAYNTSKHTIDSVHPIFGYNNEYIFFFTALSDLDNTTYIPFIIDNSEFRILKKDGAIVSKMALRPYRLSNRNNLFLINKTKVDADEFFEVTECFFFNNSKLMRFRIIDNDGGFLYGNSGIPQFRRYLNERVITIFQKGNLRTLYLKNILPKNVDYYKYVSMTHLIRHMFLNIFTKVSDRSKLTIKKRGNINFYTYKCNGKTYISKQTSKNSSFSQQKN